MAIFPFQNIIIGSLIITILIINGNECLVNSCNSESEIFPKSIKLTFGGKLNFSVGANLKYFIKFKRNKLYTLLHW